MTSLSAATDVFELDPQEKSIVLGLSRRRPRPDDADETLVAPILRAIADLAQSEWTLSVAGMFGGPDDPAIYETGPSSDMDFITAFEAPSVSKAFAGIEALESVRWDHLFTTAWIVGRREFAPVPTAGRNAAGAPWAMFALWEWNDAWQAATSDERATYDAECDQAFQFDVEAGVSIAGRHRMDYASAWHHLGIWEAPSYDVIDRGMVMHERVADFKFTTSRHYLARSQDLNDHLVGAHR